MKVTLTIFAAAFLLLTGISCTTAQSREEGDAIVPENIDMPDEGGWLGVSVEDLTPALAKKLKADAQEGVIVSRVQKQSPAEKAGLRENDIIVGVNKHDVSDRWDLVRRIRSEDPGTSVTLSVIRDSKKQNLTAVLGENPEPLPVLAPVPEHLPHPIFMSSESQTDGLRLMTLNEQLGEYFGAPNSRGVLVEEVGKGSSAEGAGFRAGDVIIRIGNNTVEDIEDFHNALRHYDQGDTAKVDVMRKGSQLSLTLQLAGEDRDFHFRSHWLGPHWDHQSFEWNSQKFKSQMKEFGDQMRQFGKDLQHQMKGMKERIREELRHIEI